VPTATEATRSYNFSHAFSLILTHHPRFAIAAPDSRTVDVAFSTASDARCAATIAFSVASSSLAIAFKKKQLLLYVTWPSVAIAFNNASVMSFFSLCLDQSWNLKMTPQDQ